MLLLPYNPRAMLHFRLFGVPVAIHPSVWIVLAILGGGLHVNNAAGLLPIGLFVIAGFISLLAHEFGHALVGKWLCGNQVSIELAYMGEHAISTTVFLAVRRLCVRWRALWHLFL